ncbi:MAG: MerR family transcriptional regulator [Nitrospirota bacterium]
MSAPDRSSASPVTGSSRGKRAIGALSSDRLFYKIGEVSRLTGLESYVLRYWETEFPVLRPRKSSGGQRVYTKKDVDLVLQIKRMLYEQGFTIAGARKRLRGGGQADPVEKRALLGQIRGQLQSILDDLKSCAPRPVSAKPGAEHEGRGRS